MCLIGYLIVLEEGYNMRKTILLKYGGAIALLLIVCASTAATAAPAQGPPKWSSDFRPHGGYVDEILFSIYTTSEIPQAMLALQSGAIDAYDERVLSTYLPSLVPDPNIEIKVSLGSMYRCLVLNSQRFPLNITGYRRAIAFGMDKYRINMEAIGGAGQPLDSYVPLVATEWQVEDQLPTHFYDKDIVSGNASLDAAGFIDLNNDGWRDYDTDKSGTLTAGDLDSADFAIELWPTLDYGPAIAATTIAAEGMAEMGLKATVVEKDWNWLVNEVENGNHWIICWTENLPVINPPKILYDYYRTGTPDNALYYRFSNATIDAVLDDMIAATTPEDVKYYAKIATEMLAFEQPLIVAYNDANIDAYRIDKFEGYFLFSGLGVTNGQNPYAATKVKLKSGAYGGTFKYCLSEKMDTQNVIMVSTGYEATVQQYVYESLWNVDPNTWEPIPGLAYDWEIEDTTASGWVQTGQKFTFYLYDNVTWHDGEDFTSEDVKYSFMNIWPQSPQRPPELADIYNVTTPDDYTVEIWVNKTGFFEWASTTYGISILPQHIWSKIPNVTGELNDSVMAGTGPYYWNQRVPGEYISLKRYDDWRWDIRDVPVQTTPTTTPPSTTGPTTTTTSKPSPMDALMIFTGLSVATIFAVIRRRRK